MSCISFETRCKYTFFSEYKEIKVIFFQIINDAGRETCREQEQAAEEIDQFLHCRIVFRFLHYFFSTVWEPAFEAFRRQS